MNSTFSQRGHRKQFDAVIIGSGIAALSCLIELVKLQPKANIALITKSTLAESNSSYAQGGIAAALKAVDDPELHVQDTLKAGAGLSDEEVVRDIIFQGQNSIEFLERLQVQFDRDSNGQLNRGQEAGHSQRRIYHSGDLTGQAITSALLNQIKSFPQVHIFENHTSIRLITNQTPLKPGKLPEVIGLYVLDNQTGVIHTFLSQITILATGGAGKVYRYTSNPDVATGDGVAMAYRAGARVGGMEFYQFHPTLLFHPQKNNFLISEALRGEGAFLRLPKTGERFMYRYAPEQMELATRDIIARAIFNEIERSEFDYVHLDIRHHDQAFLQKRFPTIYSTLAELGINIAKDMVPVVPAAHYLCGGIVANTQGETDLPRLYAIGETAFTGFHGANRLASNSLLEGVVMGRNAAHACSAWFSQQIHIPQDLEDWVSTCIVDTRRSIQISAHWRGLRGEMSAYAGIIRTEAGLQDLQKLISVRQRVIEKYYWGHLVTRDLIELRNILLVAELIVQSALRRKESCGNHFREDYPQHFKHSTITSFSYTGK